MRGRNEEETKWVTGQTTGETKGGRKETYLTRMQNGTVTNSDYSVWFIGFRIFIPVKSLSVLQVSIDENVLRVAVQCSMISYWSTVGTQVPVFHSNLWMYFLLLSTFFFHIQSQIVAPCYMSISWWISKIRNSILCHFQFQRMHVIRTHGSTWNFALLWLVLCTFPKSEQKTFFERNFAEKLAHGINVFW